MIDYKKTFASVREIVNDVDPSYLISGGAPEDEYDSEVGKIMIIMSKQMSLDEKAKQIYTLFKENLGETDLSKGFEVQIAERCEDLFS